MEAEQREQSNQNVTNVWESDLVFELTELMDTRPALWDFRHADYGNSNVRRSLFEEIASLLDKDMDEVTVMWRNLCCRYHVERRKLPRTNSGQGANENVVKWKYFAAMNYVLGDLYESTHHSSSSTDSDEAAEPMMTVSSELMMKMVERICKPLDGPQVFGNYVAQRMRELPPQIARRAQLGIEKEIILAAREALQGEVATIGQYHEMEM